MAYTRDYRPEIWRAIRRLGQGGQIFDTLMIRGQLRGAVPRDTIRDYCKCLEAGRYLASAPLPDDPLPGALGWQLIRDPGAEAPRVRRDGQPVTMGQGRESMWRCMRILGQFTPAELAAVASTPEHAVANGEAETYCQRLARIGLLGRRPGEHDGTVYLLTPAAYKGPKPPQILRDKRIWDPNTQTLYAADGTILEQGGHRRG
jgi:hypothetical protein